jgi:hypothetical protein
LGEDEKATAEKLGQTESCLLERYKPLRKTARISNKSCRQREQDYTQISRQSAKGLSKGVEKRCEDPVVKGLPQRKHFVKPQKPLGPNSRLGW